ncbi:type II toxin-antitoxin system CcdA family antitoxin [Thiohalophilus sp.]|uniref:type II toxin-antitoxin system CcdA family antitoxin n=1 Tax=Thiohalophilus sp. TaxID=3028392 RepID=UPI002ACE3A83|nr:type II toxin-antitoxin system CcdA family antitoxin [Thiohalophilus sp.]MDZ7803504.1 type II toxin-antitoxin system CcdA family antitoxin [Thiohalophilus sp.]
MSQIYDRTAVKKATNLSINSDLLSRARSLKLNLSATLEAALEAEIKKAERDQWLETNKQAIDASNRLVEKQGLFSSSYKTL